LSYHSCSEADEIYKICSVIGTPTEETWLEGLNLANTINYQFPQLPGVPLSSLMPSASEDAINLIERLCSWDPSSRPTAAEVLQHPFFQSCFYVPPSLRPKPSVARTPPPVGPRGSFEHQSVKRYPVSLANAKPFNSYVSPKSNAAFGSGVQRKLDMVNQDGTRNTKPVRSSVRDSKYRPPGKKSPPAASLNKNRVTRSSVSETADKLANMTIGATGSRRHSVSVVGQHQQLKPPPMKAGWVGETRDMFLRPTQPTTNAYSRKVAG
jgi:protein kinase